MKLKANLTFLINSDKTLIEIEDNEAHQLLCIIELTPEQLMFYSAGGKPEDDPYREDVA